MKNSASFDTKIVSLPIFSGYDLNLSYIYHTTITGDICKDVEWWLRFASQWNDVAFSLEQAWTPAHEFQLFTDTAENLGCGAYWNGHWFSKPWPPNLLNKSIEWKELYSIVTAYKTFAQGRGYCFIVTMMQ